MITAEIYGNKVEVHEPDEIGCVALEMEYLTHPRLIIYHVVHPV